jgi:hypothetical protein
MQFLVRRIWSLLLLLLSFTCCVAFSRSQCASVSAARGTCAISRPVLTVYNRIKVPVDLQVDKSPVIAKGPFFPRVVNPRYRICGTNV